MNDKPQQETALMREQRRNMVQWSNSIPDGSFADDPSADSFDKNGRLLPKAENQFSQGGMDLGSYPQND